MEFLKALGDELYSQIEKAINEYNGNEANKDNQIKIGNLGKGDYVGKAKYEALDALLKGKEADLTTANGLIEQLKKCSINTHAALKRPRSAGFISSFPTSIR